MHSLLCWLMEHEGYWKWDGHPNIALLTSGKVSDVYVNFTQMYEQPRVMEQYALMLLAKHQHDLKKVTHVIGPAYSGIQLAHEIARYSDAKVNWGEPLTHGTNKTMTFQRFDLPKDAHVLLVDDVISTGSTLKEIDKELRLTNPFITFHHTVLCLANRLQTPLELSRVTLDTMGLIDIDGEVWSQDQRPEHLKDCGALRPKTCWNALNS